MLAGLGQFLPVAIPSLIGLGRPVDEYQWPWSVLTWLDGESSVEDEVAVPELLAADLADFVATFWKIDLPGGPPAHRGEPLSTLTEQTLTAIGQLEGVIDTEVARAIWADGLQLPSWEGGDTWVHADLMPGNLLTKDGRLTAVIDFESAGVGDPACDLIVAWMLPPAQVRPTFKRAIGTDDATWLRGRARALSMALGHIPYYKHTNPAMAANAYYTVREVFADYHGSVDKQPVQDR